MKPLVPYDLGSLNFPEKKYPGQMFPSLDEYNLRKDPGRTGEATIMQFHEYIIDEAIHRNTLTTQLEKAEPVCRNAEDSDEHNRLWAMTEEEYQEHLENVESDAKFEKARIKGKQDRKKKRLLISEFLVNLRKEKWFSGLFKRKNNESIDLSSKRRKI